MAVSLSELVRMAEEGQFRVGAYARPIVWGPKQTVAFFDSVSRGYPTGQLLFAEQPAGAEEMELGGVAVHAPSNPSAWAIIDGLQRLSALVGAWNAKDDSPYLLCYDLEEMHFATGPPQHPLMLPVPVAVHRRKLLDWLRERPFLSEDDRSEALSLGSRLTGYAMPVIVMRGLEDASALHEVFTRINRGGVSLAQADLDRARKRPRKHDGNVAALSSHGERLGFGRLSEELAAQCVVAALFPRINAPAARAQTLQRYRAASRHTPVAGETRLPEALSATVRWLRKDGRIPHVRLLPATVALPVLVRFFSVFNAPDPHVRELLRRWLWRMDVVRREADERRALEAVANTAAGEVQRLLDSLPPAKNRRYRVDLHATGLESPEGRMNVLGLLGAQPLLIVPSSQFSELPGAPLTDSGILTPWLDSAEAMLCQVTGLPVAEAATLGHFLLHPPVSQEQLLESVMALPPGHEALKGQFIDDVSAALLRQGRFHEFALRRDEILSAAISRRIQSFARVGFREKGRLPTLTGDGYDG
ncbi:GmrSD restriction endonuclease domain-containing protein [Micromonospora carbonacea]|uniref:GmrSD restriction endonuclease domain-containing protein n=1 Tax=Micromonospora carbonacea TaxID=47853 RepID=UPI0037205A3A